MLSVLGTVSVPFLCDPHWAKNTEAAVYLSRVSRIDGEVLPVIQPRAAPAGVGAKPSRAFHLR